MKNVILLSLSILLSWPIIAQGPKKDSASYPYVLPIWADKVVEKGYGDQMQLPFGISAHYVNAYIDLEITEFELLVGDQDLTGIINTNTLNFTAVNATTNGINLRADAWIFPFFNLYGLFSSVKGSTGVSLQPTWKDVDGEIILQLPEFSSKVEFDALAYGGGGTFVYGFDQFFINSDFNFSYTQTELLNEQILYGTFSSRVGRRFNLSKTKKDMFVAGYIGAMYRDFMGAKGSSGSIGLDEVFPGIGTEFNMNVDEKIAENDALIAELGPGPAGQIERKKLEAKNIFLEELQSSVNESGLFTTTINYFIQKEMIQSWTFQFGFNFQVNKHWAFRGEYGVSDSQRFLMTGLQYRFGL